MTHSKKLLSLKDLAERWGVSYRSLHAWTKIPGKTPVQTVLSKGKYQKIRFSIENVEKFEQQKTPTKKAK